MPDTSIETLLSSIADRIADTVVERLVERLPHQQRDDGLVDEPEMARRLCVSQPTLQRMRAVGSVPFVKLGRRIAYHPPTVLSALNQSGRAE